MLIVPFLIYGGLLLLAVLSIALAIVHRCGRLKKVRHIYLVGTVAIITLVLALSAAGGIKYRIAHFPLTQPNTTWSTEDRSITLEVSGRKSDQLPSDWYEYDMQMLVDGEYTAVELHTAGHWDGELSITDPSRIVGPYSLVSGSWYMAGSGKLVINGDERIVLRRS